MTNQLRQSGFHQGDGQLPLSRPVERRDQGAQLTFFDVLHLIDEQDQHGAPALAASPATWSREVRSVSRSPLSATPSSRSMSMDSVMSSKPSSIALTNPASARRARFDNSRAAAPRCVPPPAAGEAVALDA